MVILNNLSPNPPGISFSLEFDFDTSKVEFQLWQAFIDRCPSDINPPLSGFGTVTRQSKETWQSSNNPLWAIKETIWKSEQNYPNTDASLSFSAKYFRVGITSYIRIYRQFILCLGHSQSMFQNLNKLDSTSNWLEHHLIHKDITTICLMLGTLKQCIKICPNLIRHQVDLSINPVWVRLMPHYRKATTCNPDQSDLAPLTLRETLPHEYAGPGWVRSICCSDKPKPIN